LAKKVEHNYYCKRDKSTFLNYLKKLYVAIVAQCLIKSNHYFSYVLHYVVLAIDISGIDCTV